MVYLKYKSLGLSSILFFATTTFVNAQEINSYEDFKLYCSDVAYQYDVASPNCGLYKQYQDRYQQELNQQKTGTTNQQPEINRRKITDTKVQGYAGVSLGAFFPGEDGLDTGFGGSVFIGAKWNQYIGTDLEFIYLGGGTDFDEVDYSVWGLAINPRFFIPFTKEANSIALFISPGFGISTAEAEANNFSVEDETRLTWQIKAGLSIPIQEKYNAFVQIRYASQFEEDTVDFIGAEAGFSVNF